MNNDNQFATTSKLEVPPLHILIVDDHRCMAHLLDISLRRHLHHLESLLFWSKDAGRLAIKTIAENQYKPNFALLDIRINGINGLDVYRVLQKESPETVSLFMTAIDETEADYQEVVREVGENKIIRKDKIRFFEDIIHRIPNYSRYLKCKSCINGGDERVCNVRIKDG